MVVYLISSAATVGTAAPAVLGKAAPKIGPQ